MTTIRVRSICHGIVDVSEGSVDVTLPDDGPPYYVFLCPECGARNDNRADARIVSILRAAGCRVFDVSDAITRGADDDEIERWFLEGGLV